MEVPRLSRRPALIVSKPWDAKGFRLYWAMMVTSEENAGWPDDIDLGDGYIDIGLPAPSVIRPAKIASFMEGSARPLGTLPPATLDRVLAVVAHRLGIDGSVSRSY